MLKRFRRSLFFLMIGLASVSSTANSAGLPAVVDAHGKVVGTLFVLSTVIREVGGATMAISVSTDGFSSRDHRVLYASTDCTGTKYMAAEGIPIDASVRPDNPTGPSGKARVYYPATPWRIVHVRSFLGGIGGDTCTTLPAQSPTRVGVLTSRVLIFTPPFKLQ